MGFTYHFSSLDQNDFCAVPPAITPFSFGSDVLDEGLYAQVSCIVQKGDPPIQISWSLKGDVVSSEPGLTTAQIGPRASILSIDALGYRHSGQYTCTARNSAGVASYSAELKVNGECKAGKGLATGRSFLFFCRGSANSSLLLRGGHKRG